MDGQTFMYFAIGGAVIALVLFMCIAIYYLIRILRDLSDATASVRETAETVNDNVQELADKVTSTLDQVLNYFVKPFALIHFLSEKLKPFMDMIPKHKEEPAKEDEDDEEEKEDDEEEEEKPRRRKKVRREKRAAKRAGKRGKK
ncbi:hypothetical protein KJ951_03170 [Patescibacteria group bacterium]|nr:hypothetical protein [Patescibacteria group bacterium]MBU1703380.1 hypothetical protein [Patescibacteria group bacterium]MBU1953825.1 hypothetical protein [Patescibacteria group bacterium]